MALDTRCVLVPTQRSCTHARGQQPPHHMVSRVVHSFSFSASLILASPRTQSLPSCVSAFSCFSARYVSSTSHERLAKRLSRSGVASRRESELLIEQGKVFVNGVKATLKDNMLVNESDVVTVFGKKIRKSQPKLWVHYKKAGILVTHKPEEEDGRPTLFPRLKEIMGLDHIISVGRLDFNSEGLLLLTNDGELARALELPENEVERVYKVRLRGQIYPDILRQLERGPVVEGVRYKPMKVEVQDRDGQPANKWITCTLSEGKNREIRRIFDSFSMPVSRIVRVKFGPYSLTTLAPGDTKQVPISWLGKFIDLKKLYPKKENENERKNPQENRPQQLSQTKISSSNIASVFTESQRKDVPQKSSQKSTFASPKSPSNSRSKSSPTPKNSSSPATKSISHTPKNTNSTKDTPKELTQNNATKTPTNVASSKDTPIKKNTQNNSKNKTPTKAAIKITSTRHNAPIKTRGQSPTKNTNATNEATSTRKAAKL